MTAAAVMQHGRHIDVTRRATTANWRDDFIIQVGGDAEETTRTRACVTCFGELRKPVSAGECVYVTDNVNHGDLFRAESGRVNLARLIVC